MIPSSRKSSSIAAADVRVFAAGQLLSVLDDGHPRAEAAHGLRQFQPDVAAADDDQMLWQAVEVQQLDVGHRPSGNKAGHVGHGRVRAQVQEHSLAADPARAAVSQTRHRPFFRRRSAPRP